MFFPCYMDSSYHAVESLHERQQKFNIQQKQGSSGGIQSGPTIKSCDFFLNPMQQMQQILILSHPILLLFTFI